MGRVTRASRSFRAATGDDLAGEDAPVTVGRVMSRDFVFARPHLPLSSLARQFIDKRLDGIPVVTKEGFLAGWIRATDLLALEDVSLESLAGELGEDARWLSRGFHLEGRRGRVAADVMDSDPLALHEDSPLETALELMLLERVHDLPVVSTDGHLRGVVSDMDALRAYLLGSEARETSAPGVRRAGCRPG